MAPKAHDYVNLCALRADVPRGMEKVIKPALERLILWKIRVGDYRGYAQCLEAFLHDVRHVGDITHRDLEPTSELMHFYRVLGTELMGQGGFDHRLAPTGELAMQGLLCGPLYRTMCHDIGPAQSEKRTEARERKGGSPLGAGADQSGAAESRGHQATGSGAGGAAGKKGPKEREVGGSSLGGGRIFSPAQNEHKPKGGSSDDIGTGGAAGKGGDKERGVGGSSPGGGTGARGGAGADKGEPTRTNSESPTYAQAARMGQGQTAQADRPQAGTGGTRATRWDTGPANGGGPQPAQPRPPRVDLRAPPSPVVHMCGVLYAPDGHPTTQVVEQTLVGAGFNKEAVKALLRHDCPSPNHVLLSFIICLSRV
jgi:hypothetical protein